MGKDYTKYKADELLNDDYFLLSELYPTEKDRKFWNQLQQADSVLAGEIESARLFLKDIKEYLIILFFWWTKKKNYGNAYRLPMHYTINTKRRTAS